MVEIPSFSGKRFTTSTRTVVSLKNTTLVSGVIGPSPAPEVTR